MDAAAAKHVGARILAEVEEGSLEEVSRPFSSMGDGSATPRDGS